MGARGVRGGGKLCEGARAKNGEQGAKRNRDRGEQRTSGALAQLGVRDSRSWILPKVHAGCLHSAARGPSPSASTLPARGGSKQSVFHGSAGDGPGAVRNHPVCIKETSTRAGPDYYKAEPLVIQREERRAHEMVLGRTPRCSFRMAARGRFCVSSRTHSSANRAKPKRGGRRWRAATRLRLDVDSCPGRNADPGEDDGRRRKNAGRQSPRSGAPGSSSVFPRGEFALAETV